MEENKKQAEELVQKEKEIINKLSEKLDAAQNIKPVEVNTDEEVLDTFASIINSKSDKS